MEMYLYKTSKLPLFDQFARFDLRSILRKLEERLYLLATAQLIGNGQQPFAISLAHSSPRLLMMIVIMILMMMMMIVINFFLMTFAILTGTLSSLITDEND